MVSLGLVSSRELSNLKIRRCTKHIESIFLYSKGD